MKKISVSAPGKLLLFGEHAVVGGYPCIVTAVDQRMRVTAEAISVSELQIDAPDVGIRNYKKQLSDLGKEMPKEVQFVEIAVRNFTERLWTNQNDEKGLKITTKSQFSAQFGFGSSSAVTACIIKALSELFKINLSEKEIFDLSFKTVLDVQGKGSGFDVAAAIYGGTLRFVAGGKVIEPIKVQNLQLVVGYSGIKADTVSVLNKVSEKFKNDKSSLENIYSKIEKIVNQAKTALISQNFAKVGEQMNENQKLLEKLGVSSEKLDVMIEAANSAGAFGAKLSGAGGGDCMIALCPSKKKSKVEKAIEQAGGEILQVKTNAEGVKIE